MVGQTIPNIMKIQFANGLIYEAVDLDEGVAKCLADGNDPFNPIVLKEEQPKYKKKNDSPDTEQ